MGSTGTAQAQAQAQVALARIEARGAQGWHTQGIGDEVVLVGDCTQPVAKWAMEEVLGGRVYGIEDSTTHRVAVPVQGKWQVLEVGRVAYRQYTSWQGTLARLVAR